MIVIEPILLSLRFTDDNLTRSLSLLSFIASQSFDFDSIDSKASNFVRHTIMRINGRGKSRGSGFIISNKYTYVIRQSVREKKTACLLVHCGALSICISTIYIYISIRAWRTCIRDFHLRKPLTFDFLLCASHLFC